MRGEIKRKLHANHLGAQACLRKTRKAFYWPRMTTDVQKLISNCSACNTFHQKPSRPWESIATDLFEF